MFRYEVIQSLNNLELSLYEYIMKNSKKVIYMRIRELAEEAHVSTTTILRFCKKLNCEGFSEFKVKFKMYIEENNIKKVNDDTSEIINFLKNIEGSDLDNRLDKLCNMVKMANSIIFLGIGFETTAPIIAMCIKIACDENINNFSVFNSLKTMPEAMKSLVLNPNIKIDAFLCPGHVATIIGENQFKKLAVEYNIPMVIAGFEVNDILASIYTIIEMNKNNKNYLVNLYSRLVKKDGNINAVNIIHEVFEKSESIWRGIGKLDNAGLIIKNKYSSFDALNKFDIKFIQESDNKGCSCGEVLMGIKEPTECNLFGNICTPLTPIGACMVSEEGTCSAYYKYK